MQNLTKTIKLRLYVEPEQILPFHQMTERYRDACNFVSEYLFSHDFEGNSNTLSRLLYREVRTTFGLKAQMTQSVFKTVTARYKTVKEQLVQKPYKYKDQNGKWQTIPKTLAWLWKPIVFHRPQADFVRNRDYSFVENGTRLSLNTLGKRLKVSFVSRPFKEYLDGSWKLGTAKLIQLKGIWYLHIPVTKAVEAFTKEKVKHVVGIDRGLRFLAVSYDEKGKTSFCSGRQILRKRQKFIEVRQKLQAKGTKSAKRVLKRLSGRENRWMSDVNHRISKTLVQKYGKDTLFVLEDLAGVSFAEENVNRSKKQKRELRSWAFYQLEQFLRYKAHENRSEVVKVAAQYTSQRCPKCGTICKEHRHYHTHEYICQCGYRSNDDRIGAMNIQLLGTQWISGNEHPKFTKTTSSE